MFIAEEKPGVFWAASEFNGIYLVRMAPLLKTVLPQNDISKEFDFRVTPLDTANGLPPGSTYLFQMNGKNVIGTEKELFRFTGNLETIGTGRQKGKFFDYERTLTSGISFLSLYINIMHQDKNGNIWMQISSKQTGRKMIIGALYDKKNKKYVLSSTPFKPIPESEILSIFSEKDGIVWFGGDDGIIRYNSTQTFDYSREYHCLIRKVVAERDSVIFGGNYFSAATDSSFTGISYAQPEELKARIDYSFNSIGFDFAATTFYNEESNQYRYYLEGFDKKWSDWNKITRKEYTNLSPGTYIFRVKARNIFGFESPEATYEFTILPPWYRTNFAYIMYILLFGATIFGAVKYSNRRLRKAKIRLERIVEERTQKIVEQKQQIETERDKSEKLLLNILPAKIAEELKSNGFAMTQRHPSATVMFTDFKDFTKIASSIEPEELIRVLDRCFGFFDDVCLRHNVEKLKTVGDSYMCAGGIPTPTYTHPVDVTLAAFEMLDYIGKLKIEHSSQRRTLWKIRIGIHTGGVIAGVVGKNKFAYDIWGDTVNVAARLEQTGKPNYINISGETYQLIKDFFICSYRGKIPAKNKGEIDMYFVDRIHPDLSADTLGRHPNHLFHEKMKQNYEAAVLEKIEDVPGEADFNKARDYIINRLTHELNPNLFYHGVHHTLDVYDAAVRIAEMEKVTGEDLMLIKTAALFHDCGFLMKYRANEPSAVLITREVLPQFGYSQKQIELISQMIISTELPQHPITHLDMIVCDADLDYMGRDDFFMTALTLHREWNEYGLTHSIRQWYSQQIKFVEKHHYYTASAKLLRGKKKEMHIQQMKELLSIEPNN
ncbi:MAG: adenylate/guanylate cyclase domain-containing protein, partial [Bacteroidota bacterium]